MRCSKVKRNVARAFADSKSCKLIWCNHMATAEVSKHTGATARATIFTSSAYVSTSGSWIRNETREEVGSQRRQWVHCTASEDHCTRLLIPARAQWKPKNRVVSVL